MDDIYGLPRGAAGSDDDSDCDSRDYADLADDDDDIEECEACGGTGCYICDGDGVIDFSEPDGTN